MKTYILKRLFWLVPTLFIITIISYTIMRIAPGDPVRSSIVAQGGSGEGVDGGGGGAGVLKEGEESTAAKQFRKRFYLDRPPIVGYGYWLRNIIVPRGLYDDNIGENASTLTYVLPKFDFGESITVELGTPVWDLIKKRVWVTAKLNIWAIAIIYLIAIPSGLYSAIFRNSLPDRISSFIFFVLYSLPSFWVGLMLVLMVSKHFPSWPTSGIESTLGGSHSYWEILLDSSKRYIMPVLCMSYAGFASLSRFSRVGMLEVISQDYIRTARAKGLSEWKVVMKHALRNSVIPLITMMAGMLPALIGGSVLIEYIFNIPGMGSLSVEALGSRDYPVMITIFSFGSLLTLFGILISDITYSVVDPRISFD